MKRLETVGMTAEEMCEALDKLLSERREPDSAPDSPIAQMVKGIAGVVFEVVALNNQRIAEHLAEHLAACNFGAEDVAAIIKKQMDRRSP